MITADRAGVAFKPTLVWELADMRMTHAAHRSSHGRGATCSHRKRHGVGMLVALQEDERDA
jgi:hypothetical protein